MKLSNLTLIMVGFLLGSIASYVTDQRYLNGRLSACKEIVAGLNEYSNDGIECFIENSEVIVTLKTVPGIKFYLDGRIVED